MPAAGAAGSIPAMNHPIAKVVAATAILAATASAQIARGSAAPSFEFEKVWNDGPADFAKLAGLLVILDFSQTW